MFLFILCCLFTDSIFKAALLWLALVFFFDL